MDVEDRFYDTNWNDLTYKPIETRNLYHPDFKAPQGFLTMWLEIFDKKDKRSVKPWDIDEPPELKFEMRLVVWKTRDIPNMDVEETSDVYVVGFLDPKKTHMTDTHFRCMNGSASFNWRMLERFDYSPASHLTNLQIQVFDKDIFSADDYICSGVINLKQILDQIYLLDIPISFTQKLWDQLELSDEESNLIEWESDSEFWIKCSRTDEFGQQVKAGAVMCSLEILPIWKADMTKVGKGRDEPNCNPYLPPPVGRISFSLNPITMINQFVGPGVRRKFYMWALCLLCSIIGAFFLPDLFRYFIAALFDPFTYWRMK